MIKPVETDIKGLIDTLSDSKLWIFCVLKIFQNKRKDVKMIIILSKLISESEILY